MMSMIRVAVVNFAHPTTVAALLFSPRRLCMKGSAPSSGRVHHLPVLFDFSQQTPADRYVGIQSTAPPVRRLSSQR